uniref:PiggyBac transposable element-derived protein domain-containing protein n=1 Tax=Sipha flava TaxID=143950 RepID=A0A2S2QPD4_9HEMI
MNNDKNTNKVIEWLQEDEDTNISDLNSETDTESEHSNHDTESEQSGNSDSDNTHTPASNNFLNTPCYVGKDGTKWLIHKPQTTKTARQNIITKLPGVKGAAKNSKTILDCWKIFFPDNIIIYIVECTNQQLNLIRSNYTRGERDCPPTNFEEILAFFGLLYLAGVKKAQHLNTDELWSTDGTAPEFFSATMSKRRFHTLVQAIRFDDRNSRLERKKD